MSKADKTSHGPAARANPFRPSFGVSPPVLAGRAELLARLERALVGGVGYPDRATIYHGPRGAGKTVMLKAAEDVARSLGWWVVSETAGGDLQDRIVLDHLPRLIAAIADEGTGRRVRSVSVTTPAGGGAVEWDPPADSDARPSLRYRLLDVCDAIEASGGGGLLLSIDEVHAGGGALSAICTEVQHLFGAERDVALVMAGLTNGVEDLLRRDPITFLRRAARHELGSVAADEVAAAIRVPIVDAGRTIDAPSVGAAVDTIAGYPFMIQLVGFYAWERRPDRLEVSLDDVRAAAVRARAEVGELVYRPAIEDLSDRDRDVLVAMTLDGERSRTAELAQRLGVTTKYLSVYRARLLRANLIRPDGRGYVRFSTPYLRDYVGQLVDDGIVPGLR